MNSYRPIVTFAACCLAVAALYLARVVLIPVALALLLAFLLDPLVEGLRKIGLPRAAGVGVVLVLVLVVSGGVAFALTWQARSLVADLPRYRDNIKAKISDLRSVAKMPVPEGVQETIDDIVGELKNPDGEATAAKKDEPPTPVDVVEDEPTMVDRLPLLLEPLGTVGLVIVLVTFILFRRGEVRERVVRLVGLRRISVTTQALDEAASRISRYLLAQCIVNGTFGVGIGVGLFLIGVPYSLLWGLLAATLRFIPYIGPWLAGILPIGLSIATSPGWTQPALVFGLFLVLELSSNLIMEPLLYSDSAGVSEVAILVAIAFWTWLWGPVGFILATPLTVCIVVLGKHVQPLQFLWILTSNEPVIVTDKGFYQRLLVRDSDAAVRIVEESGGGSASDAALDEILLPALVHVRRDARNGDVTPDDENFVLGAIREIVDETPARRVEDPKAEKAEATSAPLVLGCSYDGGGENDALALELLAHRIESDRMKLEIGPNGGKFGEIATRLSAGDARAMVVGAMPPGGLARVRSLCLRIRSRHPDLPIVVGRWGATDTEMKDATAVLEKICDRVVSRLVDCRKALASLLAAKEPVPSEDELAAAGKTKAAAAAPTA